MWPGWEAAFPSYWAYQGLLLAIGFASFWAIEWLGRRWLAAAPPQLAAMRTTPDKALDQHG